MRTLLGYILLWVPIIFVVYMLAMFIPGMFDEDQMYEDCIAWNEDNPKCQEFLKE
jgi:hypothetical protein